MHNNTACGCLDLFLVSFGRLILQLIQRTVAFVSPADSEARSAVVTHSSFQRRQGIRNHLLPLRPVRPSKHPQKLYWLFSIFVYARRFEEVRCLLVSSFCSCRLSFRVWQGRSAASLRRRVVFQKRTANLMCQEAG
ncbi:hypothetical protein TRVL_03846 [Trypanosoma vivax]|nr:hypothetical protein TRVL_03846 [Trypanosoma vivax]